GSRGLFFKGQIEGAARFGVERTFADIFDHADDLHGALRLVPFEVYPHADWIQPHEILARERVINHNYVGLLGILVGIAEVAPFEEARLQGLEIPAAYLAPGDFVVLSGTLVAEDDEIAGAVAVADGQSASRCCSRYAGQR